MTDDDYKLIDRNTVDREFGEGDGRLKRWLEKAAVSGDGPPMVRLSRGTVRYRRADIKAWIDSRLVRSTSEEVAT